MLILKDAVLKSPLDAILYYPVLLKGILNSSVLLPMFSSKMIFILIFLLLSQSERAEAITGL